MNQLSNDKSFKDYLQGHVVLFDGAMGTLIYQRGIFIDKCYDSLNLTNAGLIESIHDEYIKAGAVVIETNTFGANRYKLRQHNLQSELKRINTEGARIARKIAKNRAYVAGSIGPLGVPIKPWGEISLEKGNEAFSEQAEALLKGNVDLFSLETFQNLDELEEAVRAIQSICDLPIIAQMAIQEDGRSYYGASIDEFIKKISDLNVASIGLNCALGPKPMLDFLEQMSNLTSLPISVMPNAGLPQSVDGRMIYLSTPDYFGVYTKRFIESGATIVGGCCGTTPEHIQKMANTVAQKQTRMKKSENISITIKDDVILPEPIAIGDKSLLSKKLMEKDFVILMEMVPPRGRDLKKQTEAACLLKESGVDAVNIPDGPRASARLNGIALAVHLQEKIGIETVLHYTCRDRNLLGIQSELLGASVLGIKNILAITGDPPMIGDYPQSTAVFDIDSIGLTRILRNMNFGLDLGQKQIGEPTRFFIGIGVDPNSINLNKELDRFKQKVEAGAEFVITQPVFDLSALRNFIEKVNKKMPFIAGIWPLVSLRNAEFMRNEVPGVYVPEDIIKKMSQYNQREDQLKIGIEIAQKLVDEVQHFTQGIQISAPFGRFKEALKVTEPVLKKS